MLGRCWGRANGAHVHVHIIPRKKRDYGENDEIYNDLEQSERTLEGSCLNALSKIDDKERIPRTEEGMNKEAEWLASYFDK